MIGWKFTTASSYHLRSEIEHLCDLAINDPKNKLNENYREIKDDIACTVGFYDNEPVTMSFIHDRKVFNGMLRILSRFYFYGGLDISHYPRDDYPGPHKLVRPSTKQMMESQIEFCSKVGCDDIFFSKERNKYVVRRFCDAIGFETDDNKYKVTSKDYQYVGWKGNLCLQKQ